MAEALTDVVRRSGAGAALVALIRLPSERLVVSVGAVEQHIGNIFDKLGLVADEEHHRRVRVVVTWLAHHER